MSKDANQEAAGTNVRYSVWCQRKVLIRRPFHSVAQSHCLNSALYRRETTLSSASVHSWRSLDPFVSQGENIRIYTVRRKHDCSFPPSSSLWYQQEICPYLFSFFPPCPPCPFLWWLLHLTHWTINVLHLLRCGWRRRGREKKTSYFLHLTLLLPHGGGEKCEKAEEGFAFM